MPFHTHTNHLHVMQKNNVAIKYAIVYAICIFLLYFIQNINIRRTKIRLCMHNCIPYCVFYGFCHIVSEIGIRIQVIIWFRIDIITTLWV